MMEGGGEVVPGLIQQLVGRLLPSQRGRKNGSGSVGADRSFQYAMRIIGSRIAPSVVEDEAATGEAIARKLVQEGRSFDALTFADLHRRFASQTGPGSVEDRWAVLYLLRAVAEDHRRDGAETRGSAVSLTSAVSRPRGGIRALAEAGAPAPPAPKSGFKSGFKGGGALDYHDVPRTEAGRVGAGGAEGSQGVVVVSNGSSANNARAVAVGEFAETRRVESDLGEEALVRDVVYVCEGIEGRFVTYDEEEDGFVVDPESRVAGPTKVLVRRLCELGWLYRRVRHHIFESLEDGPLEAVGTVGQAFCAALHEELGEYYRLMAVLETQVHNPIPVMAGGEEAGGNYLSLRRLAVWMAEPLTRMRLMALLVDDCKTLRGGAMAGAIHMHAQHGDPFVRSFLRRLLQRVCAPLYEMVRRWVLEGEVDDPHGEFFIVAQPVKAEALWRDGYKLQTTMLPSFMPESLAQSILRTGKSINFLRVCCEDQGWAKAASDAVANGQASTNGSGGLGYGETDALEILVVEAARRIDRHLIEIIHERYKFRDHCLAIKRYLLLGQGDFIQYLMDLVGPELSLPANAISSFRLSSTLESAIRASNAQYDDMDILDKLKVKLMPHGDGARGWDVFSLDYNAQGPLTTIFTEDVMTKYLQISNFLWRLKRVEHALSATWQTMKPTCSVAQLTAMKSRGQPALTFILRRCQTLRTEMNHFVINLQYYIMFEVLEFSWANFSEEMETACDLDGLIRAHEKYLGSILEKSLLDERSQLLSQTLSVLFDLILRFRSLADRFFERAQETDSGVESVAKRRLEKGGSSSATSQDKSTITTGLPSAGFLASIRDEMEDVALEFSSVLEKFITQLPTQQHVDLKFLSFRLDFSEFYTRLQTVTRPLLSNSRDQS